MFARTLYRVPGYLFFDRTRTYAWPWFILGVSPPVEGIPVL